jgi:hypothetical protein
MRSLNIYSRTTKKSNSRKNQSTSFTNKTGLTEEMIESCRNDLINYYVCYGSAVVNVRNAERKINYTTIWINFRFI